MSTKRGSILRGYSILGFYRVIEGAVEFLRVYSILGAVEFLRYQIISRAAEFPQQQVLKCAAKFLWNQIISRASEFLRLPSIRFLEYNQSIYH